MEETSNYTISEPANDTDALLAELRGHALSDTGNAERLIAWHGINLRYVPEWKSWITWKDGQWSRASSGDLLQFAQSTVNQMYVEAAGGDRRDRTERLAWAHTSESRAKLSAMVALAQGQPGVEIQVPDLDKCALLLNIRNGTVNLSDVAIQDHNRDDHITRTAPVQHDPKAMAPQWNQFVRRIMGDDPLMVAYLQRIAGYLLTGLTTEHQMFLAYGDGANGKTTFFSVLMELLGPYAAQLPSKVLLQTKQSKEYDLAVLPGIRMAVASETPPWGRFDEALVKTITGGEKINARLPYGNPFHFPAQFKVVLTTNYLPEVKGMDDGIWRRMALIPFLVTIPEHERDTRLLEKLRSELPGILNWALEGLRQWQKIGLAPPIAVQDALRKWRQDSNPVTSFLAERVVSDPESRVSVAEIHLAYLAFAKEEGERYPLKKQAFRKEMEKLGFERHGNMPNGADAWQGVKLKERVWPFGSVLAVVEG